VLCTADLDGDGDGDALGFWGLRNDLTTVRGFANHDGRFEMVFEWFESAVGADERVIWSMEPGDFDGDLLVNAEDLAIFKPQFFSTGDLDADLDGDGLVNAADLAILKTFFFKPPGPSGLVP